MKKGGNKRKITVITTILTLGLTLAGLSFSAKASEVSSKTNNNTYFKESTTEYFENKNSYYYREPFHGFQWDIKRVTNNGASFYLESGNHNVVVGIIDSGVDTDHPDLKDNLLGGVNLVPANSDEGETGDLNDIEDRTGHGTEVAGEIAANGNGKGVAPNIGFRFYRISGKSGKSTPERLAAAIIRAVDDGVKVINISHGVTFFDVNIYTKNSENGEEVLLEEESKAFKGECKRMKLIEEAVEYANTHNVVVVTSAGNDCLNCESPEKLAEEYSKQLESQGMTCKGKVYRYPAMLPSVINVSATNRSDKKASYSNYGHGYITVAAPGGEMLSKNDEENYRWNICYSKEVKKKICDTADKAGDEKEFGAGIINVYNALK